jgi:glycosyltransferase involved in cell wall biosynthesis
MNISVVIPAYQARRFLSECLESIGAQTMLPFEVLVIDDASPEPVDGLIEEFSRRPYYPSIRLLKHPVNLGQAAARNTGIEASNGDLLAFIDCDDVWAPRHLELAIDTIDKQKLDLVFCPATIFEDSIDSPTGFVERPMSAAEMAIEPLALLERCFIIMSSVVAKRQVVLDVGCFDESKSMRAVEDLDLFMKLLKHGCCFGMSCNSTLFYRKHPESATGRPTYMAYQCAYVRDVHVLHISGSFFRKCSLVAEKWWDAFRLLPFSDPRLRHALWRALLWSLPVPWEIVRVSFTIMKVLTIAFIFSPDKKSFLTQPRRSQRAF